MGPAGRFEIRQRDAFALALWELGHYRQRRGVPPMQRERPGKGADVRPDWQSVESQFPALVTM
jgi:hypothetical protein